jgi:hypothetical protein
MNASERHAPSAAKAILGRLKVASTPAMATTTTHRLLFQLNILSPSMSMYARENFTPLTGVWSVTKSTCTIPHL